jgi:hypothetical protein
MTRTFIHDFDPADASPLVGASVDLTVSEKQPATTSPN